jgi:hypothetical protein
MDLIIPRVSSDVEVQTQGFLYPKVSTDHGRLIDFFTPKASSDHGWKLIRIYSHPGSVEILGFLIP